MGKNYGKILERIIGKTESIIGSGLREAPTTMQITLKKAKNDQFGKGIQYIWVKLPILSVQWMNWSSILLFKAALQGHRFYCITTNNSPEHHLTQPLRKPFKGYHRQLNTHSFRTGAATSAKCAGVSASHLKALGR